MGNDYWAQQPREKGRLCFSQLISQLNPGFDATNAMKFSGFLRKKWGCGGMRDTQQNPMVHHHFHD